MQRCAWMYVVFVWGVLWRMLGLIASGCNASATDGFMKIVWTTRIRVRMVHYVLCVDQTLIIVTLKPFTFSQFKPFIIHSLISFYLHIRFEKVKGFIAGVLGCYSFCSGAMVSPEGQSLRTYATAVTNKKCRHKIMTELVLPPSCLNSTDSQQNISQYEKC